MLGEASGRDVVIVAAVATVDLNVLEEESEVAGPVFGPVEFSLAELPRGEGRAKRS